VLFPFARILRLASFVICLIAIASFALFAINQTGAASAHQQKVLNGEAAAPSIAGSPNASGEPSPAGATSHQAGAHSSGSHSEQESSARSVIDDASNALTSPFSGVTAGSSSEWTIRSTRLLLALAVYGFGLGFLARVLRLRV